MVRRICCLIKMFRNFLLCVSWQHSIEIFRIHTQFFIHFKDTCFRYLLVLQDSAKYSVFYKRQYYCLFVNVQYTVMTMKTDITTDLIGITKKKRLPYLSFYLINQTVIKDDVVLPWCYLLWAVWQRIIFLQVDPLLCYLFIMALSLMPYQSGYTTSW